MENSLLFIVLYFSFVVVGVMVLLMSFSYYIGARNGHNEAFDPDSTGCCRCVHCGSRYKKFVMSTLIRKQSDGDWRFVDVGGVDTVQEDLGKVASGNKNMIHCGKITTMEKALDIKGDKDVLVVISMVKVPHVNRKFQNVEGAV